MENPPDTAARYPQALLRHPISDAPAVRRVAARAQRRAPGVLLVSWLLEGDLARLRIPPFTRVSPGERLWEHTCFELFFGRADAEAYRELNVAPSGAWAAYAFRRYREAAEPTAREGAPGITVRRSGDRLEVDAVLALEDLDPDLVAAPLRVGLCAVIEDDAGGLSWWALRHAADRPDFHRAEAFRELP